MTRFPVRRAGLTRLALATAGALALAACGQGGGEKTAEAPAAGGAPAAPGGADKGVVWAAGSSTVFPFASAAAEAFARKTGGAAPRIESLGTGGGIKAFCSGVGEDTPDIALASRPMKASEYEACRAAGVTDIAEVTIGFDGIAVATARSGADLNLNDEQIFRALAKQVPGPNGQMIANPNKTWKQVSASLPDQRILVYGPPPTSGTRDAFLELAVAKGAEKIPSLKAMKESDEDGFKAASQTLREDGGWVDAGENDNAVVQTLERTPGSVGVFGYSYLEENGDKVKAAKIDGVAPSLATISDGSYPLSRSLYLYVKKAHLPLKPAIAGYLTEITSDAAVGRGGYMQTRGLIPLPADKHNAQKDAVKTLPSMAAPKS